MHGDLMGGDFPNIQQTFADLHKPSPMDSQDDYHNILGLEHKKVQLVDPTPLWQSFYLDEEQRIRHVIGHLILDIQHVGSTAIPGIKAKPIIDMMAGLPRLDMGLECVEPLEAIGYDYAPHAGIPGDHVFGKGVARTHLLHVVEYGGSVWIDELAFRDALRRDRVLAMDYEDLKIRLAREFPGDRARYTEAKGEFIRGVVSGRG